MPSEEHNAGLYRYDVEVRVGGEWDEIAVMAEHRADAKHNALHTLERLGFDTERIGRAIHPDEDRPPLADRVSRHRQEIGLEGSWFDELLETARVGIGKVGQAMEAGKEEIDG